MGDNYLPEKEGRKQADDMLKNTISQPQEEHKHNFIGWGIDPTYTHCRECGEKLPVFNPRLGQPQECKGGHELLKGLKTCGCYECPVHCQKPEKPDWEEEVKIMINEWVKRLISFGYLKEVVKNQGFTIYECPELEPLIRKALSQQKQSLKGKIEKLAQNGEEIIENSGYDTHSGYMKALSDILAILEEEK